MLSCFVFQEKTESEPLLSERLKKGRATILEIAERVGKVQDYWKVGAGEGEVQERFKPGLMEVVYEWARGMVSLSNFSQNCIANFGNSPLRRSWALQISRKELSCGVSPDWMKFAGRCEIQLG